MLSDTLKGFQIDSNSGTCPLGTDTVVTSHPMDLSDFVRMTNEIVSTGTEYTQNLAAAPTASSDDRSRLYRFWSVVDDLLAVSAWLGAVDVIQIMQHRVMDVVDSDLADV